MWNSVSVAKEILYMGFLKSPRCITALGAVDLRCLQPTNDVKDLNMLSIRLLLGGCVKYEDI